MRLYFYISEVVELNQLSKIILCARQKNKGHNITGLITYNKGFYLQVVEGSDEPIQQLIENISKDKRHKNIQVILNIETNHRYFNRWNMKLVPVLSNDTPFEIFMKLMASNLNKIPGSKQNLLKIFYNSESLTDNVKDEPEWQSTGFTLSRWPNFSKITATPNLMSLCAALMNIKVSYPKLCSEQIYPSEIELRKILLLLRDDGCLTFLNEDVTTYESSYLHKHSEKTFMSKMKNFINARLH